ncbi:MAG TPA: glycine cleavage system aminomethyltransferase GcvT [Actinomycetota bacterium]|nr:glycine cleavage system aminomethyltransferase GcvT [Actinomycetota bacterium]
MPILSPLHDRHVAAGAKFADFAGWSMPIEYAGVLTEHNTVRGAVGVFDVSHLGTLTVRGPLAPLNTVLSNDLRRITDGQAQYTLVLNEQAGVVDDLIAYRVGEQDFLLIPNAANCSAVADRIEAVGLEVADVTRQTAILAVQGPDADALVAALGVPSLDYMAFGKATVAGVPTTVCRTGYTGERGVELLVPAEQAAGVWDAVTAAGAVPCGLGARDTLRTEMGYPLHGHELLPDVPARWSAVGWAVAVDKGEFVGRDAYVRTARERKVVGLRVLDRGVPRAGMSVHSGDAEVGQTTSGTFSPTLGCGIALARVESSVTVGDQLDVMVRGRRLASEVVKMPFVPSHVRDE